VSQGEYSDRNWLEIEEDARRGWEQKDAGPWEDFEAAVKYAWETVTDAMSG
jgi:hypothetical protein